MESEYAKSQAGNHSGGRARLVAETNDWLSVSRLTDAQVFPASFAKRPKQIDVVLLPDVGFTKIYIGEGVGFDDSLHDLLCLGDDVSRTEEPQFPGQVRKDGQTLMDRQADGSWHL